MRQPVSEQTTELARPGDRRGRIGAPARVTCRHLDMIRDAVASTTLGCEDCLRDGTAWVHLRECLTCGHIGCCDQLAPPPRPCHWLKVDHPIVRSFEPGEDWAWCYADELSLMLDF